MTARILRNETLEELVFESAALSTSFRQPEPVESQRLEVLAFLGLVDRLDHELGRSSDSQELVVRFASTRHCRGRPAGAAREFPPAFQAFLALTAGDATDRPALCAAHRFMYPEANEAGKFRRQGACRVRCSHTGVELYRAPDGERVGGLMARFFKEPRGVAMDRSRPFARFLQLLRIHPFPDGNGRVARLLFAADCWRQELTHPAYLLAIRRLYRFNAQVIHAGSATVALLGDWTSYLNDCEQALATGRTAWDRVVPMLAGPQALTADVLENLWASMS